MPPVRPALPTDIRVAVELLERRFPRIPLWYGRYTGHYWAMVDGRLLEATTANELGRQLDAIAALQPLRPGRADGAGRRPATYGVAPLRAPRLDQ